MRAQSCLISTRRRRKRTNWAKKQKELHEIIKYNKSIQNINSLGLSICDRAWEGAGWARARAGTRHALGTDWARTRARAGLGMVTGTTGHDHGRESTRTRHGHGRPGHGLGTGGLCPKVTSTHIGRTGHDYERH
jgi:hypothetical protein